MAKIRTMNIEHVRSLRDKCISAGIPFFFKQHGNWITKGQKQADGLIVKGSTDDTVRFDDQHYWIFRPKHLTGHYIDGEIYQQIPLP